MYLNFTELKRLKEKLIRDSELLKASRDRLNQQTVRLTKNTQTEEIVLQMKNTLQRLDEEIALLQKFVSALDRVCEEYYIGEDRMTDRFENAETAEKRSFISFQADHKLEIFRKLIR